MSDLVWLLRWLRSHGGGVTVWKLNDVRWYAENSAGADSCFAGGRTPLRALRNLSRAIQEIGGAR